MDFCIYIDYSSIARDKNFQKLTRETLLEFEPKATIFDCFELHETQTETTTASKFQVSQKHYFKNLDLAPHDTAFQMFRQKRAFYIAMTYFSRLFLLHKQNFLSY